MNINLGNGYGNGNGNGYGNGNGPRFAVLIQEQLIEEIEIINSIQTKVTLCQQKTKETNELIKRR